MKLDVQVKLSQPKQIEKFAYETEELIDKGIDHLKDMPETTHGVNGLAFYARPTEKAKESKLYNFPEAPCIQNITGYSIPIPRTSAMIRYKKSGSDKKLYIDWMKFITDEKLSPFKELLKDFKSKDLIHKKQDVHSFDFRFKYGFYFPTADINMMLFCALAKIVRFPKEHLDVAKTWRDLVSEGIHPGLACVYMAMLNDLKKTQIDLGTRYIGHSVFNEWPNYDIDAYLNFINGTPTYPEKNRDKLLKDTPGYDGVDNFWGNRKLNSAYKYQTKIIDNISKLGRGKCSGKFSHVSTNLYDDSQKRFTSNKNKTIDCLLEEQERLKLNKFDFKLEA